MERADELKERIRQQPLNDRLEESRRRIGDMCSKGRCPKMTIPVQHDDDDFYINTTLADAQATIAALETTILKMGENAAVVAKDAMAAKEQVAALQARVKELEDGTTALLNQQSERLAVENEKLTMALSQLAQRTAELEAAKRDRDELQSVFDLGHTRTVEADKLWQDAHGKPEVWPDLGDLVGWLIKRHDDVQAELEAVRVDNRTYINERHENMKQIEQLQADLAERTAELEAANHSAQAFQTLWRESCNQRDDLQAELERVRGERDEANELVAALSSKVAEYEVELNGDPQNFYGRGRTVGLRTLILTLPKVEGEIADETILDLWESDAITFDALRGLLQHRQGMEG